MPYTADHFGLTVRSIERSAEFYAEFGFRPNPPVVVELREEWIKTMTGFPDAHLRVTQISLGKVRLELLEYVSPEGSKSVTTRSSDVGNAHVGINVDDLDAEVSRLKAHGVKFHSAPIVVSNGPDAGVKAVYCTDPDGNVLELVEWSSERRRLRDA